MLRLLMNTIAALAIALAASDMVQAYAAERRSGKSRRDAALYSGAMLPFAPLVLGDVVTEAARNWWKDRA